MDPEPIFPPELEREIFETAALLDFRTLPSLLRVARRVLEWMEPLLYRVLTLPHKWDSPRAAACRRALRLKPTVLVNGVRHLFLAGYTDWPDNDVHTLIRLCAPQLLSFAVVASLEQPSLLPSFAHITQLRRWVGNLEDFFGGPRDGTYSALDLSLPAFRTITHMDIFDEFTDENVAVISAGLAALPCLTHLCLNDIPLDRVTRISAQCVRLCVLVLMVTFAEDTADNVPMMDVRIVLTVIGDYWADWEVAARGGTDFWAAADEFVARKRRGEIAASSYMLVHDW
ncbi:hypothetical protein C8R45DRAFT_949139 [Mycena sanguinolenta]|nr:hypothetical protein C8R45DRAFT_949139 [Mycena sanguinolenta]